MSEIQKNIETCLAENILAEVSAAPQDPLKQQAATQEGGEV